MQQKFDSIDSNRVDDTPSFIYLKAKKFENQRKDRISKQRKNADKRNRKPGTVASQETGPLFFGESLSPSVGFRFAAIRNAAFLLVIRFCRKNPN